MSSTVLTIPPAAVEGETEPPDHTIELVTNNTAGDAETISALYKVRWQIESFFKLIKQYLRIKTFIGTNKNAVMCQIWAAMLSMLLFKYLQSRSTQDWHMANLVTFVRIHLMNSVDLWKWPEYTFEASLRRLMSHTSDHIGGFRLPPFT